MNPATDVANCGGCDNRCDPGDSCKSGLCTAPAKTKTGCNGFYMCIISCKDKPCQDACQANTSPQGMMVFLTLNSCVSGACPSALASDPCSQKNLNYPTSCQDCVSGAINQGGACSAKFQACLASNP